MINCGRFCPFKCFPQWSIQILLTPKPNRLSNFWNEFRMCKPWDTRHWGAQPFQPSAMQSDNAGPLHRTDWKTQPHPQAQTLKEDLGRLTTQGSSLKAMGVLQMELDLTHRITNSKKIEWPTNYSKWKKQFIIFVHIYCMILGSSSSTHYCPSLAHFCFSVDGEGSLRLKNDCWLAGWNQSACLLAIVQVGSPWSLGCGSTKGALMYRSEGAWVQHNCGSQGRVGQSFKG